MVTKIKPRRMNASGSGSLGKDLAYQTESVFDRGAGGGDMKYADFNFDETDGATVTLGLSTEISPESNFVVVPPQDVKDGQVYILRVINGADPYTMTLAGNITNPHQTSLVLSPSSTDMFVFLAVGTTLELQPEMTGGGARIEWGHIIGDIEDQADLQEVLAEKANDDEVVHNTGDETIEGTKTFTTSPVVPSKTTDATNTGTSIATEAQVYKKVNTTDVLTKTNTTAYTPTTDYHPATKKYVDDNAGTEYNAGQGISIGDISINGRQGPSPDGFHVPSTNEWQGLKSIMDGLSLTGNGWRINLHMPFAGYRDYSDASLYDKGSNGNYWSSSPYGSDYPYCTRRLFLYSSNVGANDFNYRAYGYSVRCFKDSYATPDSTWTVIQGTLGSAGIFWNQSQGLISVTDGTTGYTMMDKNLGATTVYNDGDTLTQANMGNMYQWGNNYGFPSTGTISNTSFTQVDASAYGPTNPYSSDTFITGNEDWSSVHNDDLWGDTTGTIAQENVISNTGVLSVNGSTGAITGLAATSDVLTKTNTTAYTPTTDYHPATKKYVDDVAAGINSAERGNITGTLTDQIDLANALNAKQDTLTAGTNIQINSNVISATDTTYTAGEGISILTSAMQGPAPSGYHIPSKDERVALCGILTGTFGMASDSTTAEAYLKMPMAGYRNRSSSSVRTAGSYGLFWSSTAYSTDLAYYLGFHSSALNPQNGDGRSHGFSLRCFKDTPVIPTSSWTTLYDGSSIATGAGVFRDSTNGLISISGDGTTRYTIQDKNLGATTVYNSGDTLSQSNCGNFYQRGNNYGFPWSGAVTTSSTQVDASGYGPGNYYSSSTFITRSSYPYDRSSVQNDNLWGGVTGVVTLNNVITNTQMAVVGPMEEADYQALPASKNTDGKFYLITEVQND